MALRSEAATIRGSLKRDVNRHLSDAAIVADYFAEAVGSAAGDTPLLLVFDTFEMAQRRSRSFLGQLGEALHRMHGRLPSLRVVVAGRAPVEELTARNMPLRDSTTPSEALLTKALRGRKVDLKPIRLIVEQVSGNLLSLRLAADLVIREGSQAMTVDVGGGACSTTCAPSRSRACSTDGSSTTSTSRSGRSRTWASSSGRSP